jgi:predicted dehydrogenase
LNDIRIGLIGVGCMGKAHAAAFKNVPLVFGNEPGRPILQIIADVDEQAFTKHAAAFGPAGD